MIKNTKKDGDIPLVVSLTSWAPRFKTLHLTLKSLFAQSLLADKIVLWINETEAEALPKEIVDFNSQNFEIRFVKSHNLRSYTKIIPSLTSFPESIIVTCDDDIVYYSNWLWDLYRYSLESNHSKIICHRARLITFDQSFKLENFLDWPLLGPYDDRQCCLKVFPAGVGGVLYPPNCFYKDVLDQKMFTQLCEINDDIWLYFMSTILGIKKRKIPSNFTNYTVHEGSKNVALWHINRISNIEKKLSNLVTLYKKNGQFDFIEAMKSIK